MGALIIVGHSTPPTSLRSEGLLAFLDSEIEGGTELPGDQECLPHHYPRVITNYFGLKPYFQLK